MRWLPFFVVFVGFGQDLPNSIGVQSQAPAQVTSISAVTIGTPGAGTLYYWVVARYPGGYAWSPVGAMALNAPAVSQLSVGNFVRITWATTPGATGYDVIRSLTPLFPGASSSCVQCAVMLNTSANTVDDTGGALSDWPQAGTAPATPGTATITLNTRDESYAFLNLSLVASATERLRLGLLSGTFSNNDCVKWLGGRLYSSGAACGTGTGGSSVFPEIAVTGTSYAVVAATCGNTVTFNNAASIAVSIPAPAGFTNGCVIPMKVIGAGDAVLTAAGGVLLNGVAAGSVTMTQGTSGWLWTNGSAWQTLYRRSQCTSGVLCPLDPGTAVESFTATQDAVYVVRSNAAVTGTTANRLAKMDSSGNAVLLTTSDTGGAIGPVVSGAGTTGSATIQQVGVAQVVSQTNTTAGLYMGISAVTAGTATSSSTCPSGQVLGIWLETGVGSGTRLALLAPGICSSAGSSSGLLSSRSYSHVFVVPTGGDATSKTAFGGFQWVADTTSGTPIPTVRASSGAWWDEGGVNMTTNATNGNDAGARMNTTASPHIGGLNAPPTGGSVNFRFDWGWGSNISAMRSFFRCTNNGATRTALAVTDSIGLTYSPADNANLRVQFCEGGSCSYIDTGIAPSVSTFYELLLGSSTADTWDWALYSAGSLLASGTGSVQVNTPSAALLCSVNIVTLENVAKTVVPQRFDYVLKDR